MTRVYFFAELGFGWVVGEDFTLRPDDITRETLSDLLTELNPEPDEAPVR